MGLAETRAIEAVKGEQFENYKKRMLEITGTDLELEVDWDSFKEYTPDDISRYINERGFETLLKGMEKVCQDDLGKNAVKSAMKKIVLRGKKGAGGKESVTFDDGVIVLINGIDGNGMWREDKVQKVVEAGL